MSKEINAQSKGEKVKQNKMNWDSEVLNWSYSGFLIFDSFDRRRSEQRDTSIFKFSMDEWELREFCMWQFWTKEMIV